jgi:hypothetical protein
LAARFNRFTWSEIARQIVSAARHSLQPARILFQAAHLGGKIFKISPRETSRAARGAESSLCSEKHAPDASRLLLQVIPTGGGVFRSSACRPSRWELSLRLIDAHEDLIKICLSFTVYCGMQGICYNI